MQEGRCLQLKFTATHQDKIAGCRTSHCRALLSWTPRYRQQIWPGLKRIADFAPTRESSLSLQPAPSWP